MASVNKVILLGNLGRDPEVRSTPSGASVATVSIATTSRRRDRSSGETIETTEWHRVTFYERLAEIARDYLRKGAPVYVEGRLKYGEYTDPQGVKRYTTDIIASELQMLGTRSGASAGQSPASAPAPTPAPAASAPGGMDDDIPF